MGTSMGMFMLSNIASDIDSNPTSTYVFDYLLIRESWVMANQATKFCYFVWYKSNHIAIKKQEKYTLYYNSQNAIHLTKNTICIQPKYIDVEYHCIRHSLEKTVFISLSNSWSHGIARNLPRFCSFSWSTVLGFKLADICFLFQYFCELIIISFPL